MEGKPRQWELEIAGYLGTAVRKLGEMNAGAQLTSPLSMHLVVAVAITGIVIIIVIVTVYAHSQAHSHIMCQPPPWYMWRSEDRLTEPFFLLSAAPVLWGLNSVLRIAQEVLFPTGTISPSLAFPFHVVQDLSPGNMPLIFGVALPTSVNIL